MKQSGLTGKLVILSLLRFALSGVFIYAGWIKIRDPHAFAESIDSFRLLTPALIGLSVLTLPPLEILAGLLALMSGRVRRVGALSLFLLLAAFLAALAQAQARGLNVDCGCFGPDRLDVLSPTKNLWIAMLRDAVFGAVAWFLYAAAKKADPATTDDLTKKAPTTWDVAGAGR